MEKIIIGFSRPKEFFKPFSWIIRLIQNTPYSHVYIRFYSQKYNRWLIYQASGLLVNFIEYNRFQKNEIILKEFELEIDEVSKSSMIQYAIDNVGAPYGTKDILGVGIVLLFNLFNKKIKNPFSDGDKSFFCSKLVEIILAGPLEKNIDLDPDLSTPKDIYKYLENTQLY